MILGQSVMMFFTCRICINLLRLTRTMSLFVNVNLNIRIVYFVKVE